MCQQIIGRLLHLRAQCVLLFLFISQHPPPIFHCIISYSSSFLFPPFKLDQAALFPLLLCVNWKSIWCKQCSFFLAGSQRRRGDEGLFRDFRKGRLVLQFCTTNLCIFPMLAAFLILPFQYSHKSLKNADVFPWLIHATLASSNQSYLLHFHPYFILPSIFPALPFTYLYPFPILSRTWNITLSVRRMHFANVETWKWSTEIETEMQGIFRKTKSSIPFPRILCQTANQQSLIISFHLITKS